MEICSGLFDHQVLQRDSKNLSQTLIAGRCSTGGELQVRVTRNNRPVPRFNWKKIVVVSAGEFTVRLAGIPAGGPYQITFRVVGANGKPVEQVRVDDVLVGDVWILGGQSNMEGIGYLKDALKPIPLVRAFYMDDRWAPAQDPIHNLGQAVDQVHRDLNGGAPVTRLGHVGTGPGVAFGQKMFRLSGVPQGLIACAHGGTSMAQWDPELKDQAERSLYGATLRRFHKNGGKVAGVVWYQGCSDAVNQLEAVYTDQMKKLVAAFRRDLNDSKLPFVMVQIGGYCPGLIASGTHRTWLSVQDQQRRLSEVIDRLVTVPAIDLELDDPIHISGRAQNRLGDRLAQAAWTLRKGKKARKLPITLKAVKPVTDPKTGGLDIHVSFGNVEGSLCAAGRPAGFSLLTPEYNEIPGIYRVDLAGCKAILRTGLTFDIDDSVLYLSYGFGFGTYANVTDQADRSIPVFGPVPFLKSLLPRKVIRNVRLSKMLPGADKLQTVSCPDTSDPALGWTARTFPSAFLDLHPELSQCTDDALVFYAVRLVCDAPMPLVIGFGYDGPVKMWVDRREVFHDPNGLNPAIPDKAKVPFDAAAGQHEIVVALSANFGRAWGIILRLYRDDLTKDQVENGRETVKFPELL